MPGARLGTGDMAILALAFEYNVIETQVTISSRKSLEALMFSIQSTSGGKRDGLAQPRQPCSR